MTRQNMWRSPRSPLPNVFEVALLHHKTVASDGVGAVRYGHSGWRGKVAVTTVVGVTPQSVTNNKIKVKLSEEQPNSHLLHTDFCLSMYCTPSANSPYAAAPKHPNKHKSCKKK